MTDFNDPDFVDPNPDFTPPEAGGELPTEAIGAEMPKEAVEAPEAQHPGTDEASDIAFLAEVEAIFDDLNALEAKLTTEEGVSAADVLALVRSQRRFMLALVTVTAPSQESGEIEGVGV